MRTKLSFWFFVLPQVLFSQAFIPFNDVDMENVMLGSTVFGCGISCYDVNKDGWDDLTVGGKNTTLKLYLNMEGDFVAHNLGLSFQAEVKSVLWADYDNDGDSDLLVSLMNTGVRLYRNNGDLNFTNVTTSAGLPTEAYENWGASWGDINNDGFLDLYVTKYANHLMGLNIYARKNHLYLNNGDGTFTDISLSAGVDDGIKLSFLSLFYDFDGDGFQDIYVINDKTYPNSLYRNNGDLTFTEVGNQNGAGIVIDAMSATPGDWNNDLLEDIYITNTNGGNVLLEASETGQYSNVAGELGIQIFWGSWAANFLDGDNDGDQDLYVATTTGTDAGYPNSYFRNDGSTMTEVPLNPMFTDAPITHASGILDINNDGFPDIINHNSFPFKLSIWQNAGNDNHYLKVGVNGVISNRDGIGTDILVYTNGMAQRRTTYCGEGYLTQNSQYEIFGLDTCTLVDSLKLKWLSGIEETYYNLAVDSTYVFTEGNTFQLSTNVLPENLSICDGDSLTVCANGMMNYQWSNGDTLACTTVRSYELIELTGSAYGTFFQTLWIETQGFPEIIPDLAIQNPSCAFSLDGAVDVENPTDFLHLYWNFAEPSFPVEYLTAGDCTISWVDMYGCRDSLSLSMEAPQELHLELSIQQEDYSTENEVELLISGGIPPYSVQWSNGFQGTIAGGLDPAEYTISVYDANGCSKDTSFTIELFIGIEEQSSPFSFYPNPTSGTLYLSSPQRICRLWNLVGQSFECKIDPSFETVNLSALQDGFYLIDFPESLGLPPSKILKQED